ncbi:MULTISPECIES: polyprenyl diphosphate synthase [Burkholderia cepacia complex]|uniref:polyprenyl diphosphate synthase n=1 Tax=Burkholderia cepacia complex TaxID=87882 RepID=UPI00084127B7|nr:polyprenyl diphosphate synthase [Burkholderia metallica]AOJ35440.1 UDP pyrophosphate synthase [Burkholderia metallica]MCA8001950.1 di-trans,poly-cis-decaprenylcistransferase [Burkholderia metallica]VWB38288.1 Undecaprenyl pyrophosphate synthetase [Burkholderia metallica]
MTQAAALSAPDACSFGTPETPTASEGVPLRHLAVILDGNRRWADRLGLPTIDGYRAGGRNVHALLSWCEAAAIPMVTLWPLSTENLKRNAEELVGLLTVIVKVLDELARSGRWRLRVIGDLTKLPSTVAERIGDAVRSTEQVQGLEVNIAVAYSGRLELLSAIRALISEHAAAGSLDQLLADLSPELIASRLYTAGQPDPDLVIRTSGEQRLSNFMLWQSSFSELYFTPVCWPEFGRADFDDAIRFFYSRHRRFGL